MIISHKYKFIFIKTKKVAGTSLEIALSKYCTNSDIITRHIDEDICKELGFTTTASKSNQKKSLKEMAFKDVLASFFYSRLRNKYFHHMSASDISNCVGEKIWKQYFKFTIVRNPFDRLVSQYYWKNRKNINPVAFDVFLSEHSHLIRENWNLYTENNQILVDDFIKYENLEEDINRISKKVGLPENVFNVMKKINEKRNIRPNSSSYQDIIGKESKELILNLDREEINIFGYKF